MEDRDQEAKLWYNAGQAIGLMMKNGLSTNEAKLVFTIALGVLGGQQGYIDAYTETKTKTTD